MQREPLVACAVIARSAECVAAHEHAPPRPPERNLLPTPAHPHDAKLERRQLLLRNDVVRHPEPGRKGGAVAVVTVEELDHTGRLTGAANALLHSVTVERIDQPDASAFDERVRAALDELVLDPTEAILELVAEADAHAGDLTEAPYGASACASSGSAV